MWAAMPLVDITEGIIIECVEASTLVDPQTGDVRERL
jgi:hypothetical protein